MDLDSGNPCRNDGVTDQTASSPRLGLPGPGAREGTPGIS